MIDKIAASVADALAGVQDGATVLIGGFGTAGTPGELIDGLIAQGARDLTLVCNNAGNGDHGIAALIKAGRVRKIICSFPRQADSHVFDAAYRSGQVELELVPQGNLAERMRAAGAGIGAFFCPTGFGTEVSEAIEELRNGRGLTQYYSGGRSRLPDPLDPSRPTDDLGAPRKPEGVPSELADIVIRALDFADARNIDLGAMIEEKIAYNATRGHRHGGKSL